MRLRTGSADTATQVRAFVGGESLVIYLVDARVISHIGQVHGCFDNMLERAFSRRQDSFEIDDGLARLLDYVIRDHFPGLWIESPHPRYINPRSHHRSMTKHTRTHGA